MPRVSSKTAPGALEPVIPAQRRRIGGYVARRDYGTRGSERDKQPIRFGRATATIYRRGDIENSSWFFRLYLKEEKRHYRKSLKTTDRKEAFDLAHDEILAILAKVQTGVRVLAIALKDLLRRYKLYVQTQVESGELAKTTMRLNLYRVAHGCEFLATVYEAGMATKVSAIDGAVFDRYLKWRVEKRASKHPGATIRRDVIRDELLSIRKMFIYAKKEKLCTEKAVPHWDFVIEKEAPARRRMTQRNYTDVTNTIRSWVREGKSEKDLYHRRMLHSIFLLISNSGMRSGEVFGLRNRDVEVRASKAECVLNIRAETSKVRKGRRITLSGSSGGRAKETKKINYLIRWIDEHQRHRNPNDFVFSGFDKGSIGARDTYYHAYKQLRKKLAEIDLDWFDTYHCRHFWITNRLLAEEPIHLVARAAGTSVSEIESTYSHVLTELSTRGFNKKRVIYQPDGSWNVVSSKNEDQPEEG